VTIGPPDPLIASLAVFRSPHTIPLILIALVISAITAATALLIDWFPEQAAEQAVRVDQLMYFLVISSGAVFVIVTTFLVYSVWKFRAAPGDESEGPPIHGNHKLEVAWTILPVILLTVMTVWAILVTNRNEALAGDRQPIDVKAWQFAWEFTYPELGVSSGDLVVPVGRQVELRMRSTDVIHNFAVPELRVKRDVVPGITTKLIFDPTRPGIYPVICSELCGVGHSVMRARLVVKSKADYAAWAADARAAAQ
jgi:cytochrome c oxidase subunit II